MNCPADDSGSMLQLIADHAVDLLSVQDSYGNYVFTSLNSTQLFGWTPQELYGRSAYLFLHIRNKRLHDVFGRWGGDEFLLLLPETDAREATNVVQRIRDAIARELPGVALSFGISSAAEAGSTSDLLAHADAGLYHGKKLGGNQVIRWRADL